MNRKHIIRNLRKNGIEFDSNASTQELKNLLDSKLSIVNLSREFASGKGRIEVTFNKADETPAEILINEDIGKDPWSGEGISAKDIREILNGITPKNRPLNFLVNSPGGSVSEGCAIRNLLNAWEGVINKTIIGVAASTASWCIPADNVRAYKNSQIFMHRSMAFTMGNADELRKTINFLETTDNQIAEMYSDQAGGEPSEYLDLMKEETLLTGQQAKEIGLVDEIIDGEAKNQFTPEWMNAAKQKLAALNNLRVTSAPQKGAGKQNHNQLIMNKEKMIALLNKWGVTVSENATDEQLTALVEAGKPALENKQPDADKTKFPAIDNETKQLLEAMKNQIASTRRREIQNAVEKASSEGKIPVLEIENWVNDAVAAVDNPTTGNPVLARLNKLEPRQPGVSPVPESINKIDSATADIKDIARGFELFNDSTKAWQRGNEVTMTTIRNDAVAKANFFKKHRNRLIEVMNTNTISAGLKRQVILQDIVIRDFARRVFSLDMFSTVFRNVPLEGTNKVEVPYYDLDSSASTSFVSGTGYTTVGNTNTDNREVEVGEGATNGDRLFQALAFTSQEIARQPYLKIAQLAGLKAEKLAFDIWQDILGIITAANYGDAAITGSADTFTSDKLADLKAACKTWPETGRSLVLDSLYDANLLKDPSFKHALNAASDSAIKEGRLNPRVFGFDYLENPNIPANGENLVGFAVWKYAILVAFAPVPPLEEVRNSGTTWELITDPATGISLEYRTFGNNVTDTATHVIESSYGFAKGLGTGLKRIVSA